MEKFNSEQMSKRPGFYRFLSYTSSRILVPGDGKVHYGNEKKLTHLNWNNGMTYEFEKIPMPRDYDTSMAKLPISKTNMLLLCPPCKH